MSSSTKAEEILARFPGPVELRPSRVKWLVMLALFAGFVAGGFLGLQSDLWPPIAWLLIVFFGAGVVIALVNLVPGSGSLILAGDGFTVRALFRRPCTIRWSDTSRFERGRGDLSGFVLYDDVTAGRVHPRLTALSLGMSGHTSALPDTYGLRPAFLSAVMRRWRERAMAVAAGTGSPGAIPRP
jgi:hypothetical protein